MQYNVTARCGCACSITRVTQMAGPSALCTMNPRCVCLFGFVFVFLRCGHSVLLCILISAVSCVCRACRTHFSAILKSAIFCVCRAYRSHFSCFNSLPSRLALSFVLQEKFVAWGANSQLSLFNVTSPPPPSSDGGCVDLGSGCDESDTMRFEDSGFQIEAAPSLIRASFANKEQTQLREKAGDFIYTEEGAVRDGACVHVRVCKYILSVTMTLVYELPLSLLCKYYLIDCHNVRVCVCIWVQQMISVNRAHLPTRHDVGVAFRRRNTKCRRIIIKDAPEGQQFAHSKNVWRHFKTLCYTLPSTMMYQMLYCASWRVRLCTKSQTHTNIYISVWMIGSCSLDDCRKMMERTSGLRDK